MAEMSTYNNNQPEEQSSSGYASPDSEKTSSPEKDKIKKILNITVLVVGIALGILSIWASWKAWVAIRTYTDEFQSMANTWKQPAYGDVMFAEGACPSGWSTLGNPSWPGLSDACNVVRQNNPNKTYSTQADRACTSEELQWNCETKQGINSVEVPFWPSATTKLCYQKTNLTAVGRPAYNPKSNSCAGGAKICGNGTAGEFVFCWPSAQPCPLTDLFVDEFADEATFLTFAASVRADNAYWSNSSLVGMVVKRGGAFDSTIITNTSRIAVQGAKIIGLPIINIGVGSALPCYLGDGRGWAGRGGEYNAMQNSWKGRNLINPGNSNDFSRGFSQRSKDNGCSTKVGSITPLGYDTRYYAGYMVPENTLWAKRATGWGVNPAENAGLIPFDFVTNNTAYTYHLQVRTEVLWSEDCPRDRSKVLSNQDDVDRLKSAQLGLVVTAFLTFFIIVIVGTIINIVYACKDNDGDIRKGEEGYKTLCGFKVLKYILKIITYSCLIASVVAALGMVGFFADITKEVQPNGDLYCADELSMHSFSTLKTIIDEVSHKDVVAGFSSLGDFLSEAVGEILTCICNAL